MAGLETERVGSGPPLVLLHGGWLYGDLAWGNQRCLAERWTLIIPDRVGYGGSAHSGDGEDFDRDAELLAPALDEGSHLVGWSSGAMAAMLTAVRRPAAFNDRLEAALRAGSDTPYACMGGACGTCRARVVCGSVEMDQNFALGKPTLMRDTS